MSKWPFLLAVYGTAIIAIFFFVLGFIVTLITNIGAIAYPRGDFHTLKSAMSIFIEVIDVFMVATVFSIIALGFYELFIAKAPLPGWLKICDLDDLKEKLLGLVIIALAVVILGETLTWDGSSDILALNIASAAGIAAILQYILVRE